MTYRPHRKPTPAEIMAGARESARRLFLQDGAGEIVGETVLGGTVVYTAKSGARITYDMPPDFSY